MATLEADQKNPPPGKIVPKNKGEQGEG